MSMPEEFFFSGYCRMLDGSRTVTAETEGGKLTDVDCCYGNCVYQGSCPIAERIDKIKS